MNDKYKNPFKSARATLLFYSAFAALFIYIIYINRSTLGFISYQSLGSFAAMVVLTVGNFGLRALINVITFSSSSKRVGFSDGYRYAALQTVGNYLPFSGGLIAKGVILKKEHDIGYVHYAAITVYTFITAISVSGVLGLAAVLASAPESRLLIGLFALLALAGVFIFVPLPGFGFVKRRLAGTGAAESRRVFRPLAARIALIYSLMYVISTLRLWIGFSIISQPAGFFSVLVIISGSILTRFVTFTPGAIGVREAVAAGLAHLTMVDFQMAIIAVGISRLAEILVGFSSFALASAHKKRRSGSDGARES